MSSRIVLYAVGAMTSAAMISAILLLWRPGMELAPIVLASIAPSLLLGAIALAARYLCRATPLRTTAPVQLIATHLAVATAATGAWALLWRWQPITPLLILGALLYLAAVTVHYLVIEVEAAREAEEAALRYQVLARQAELRAFKAQLDPHFLFNSLNSVASLCGSRPNDAREMATRLAEFFRMMLRVGSLERISLAEEIDLVSRYLAIEKVRFGDRLTTRINVANGAAQCMVPPLLLQPLVENAVRHGIASVVEGGIIDIDAKLHDGTLKISIDNPADPDRVSEKGEGVGLENAAGRLRAISEGRANIRADEDAGRFHVDIELPR
jgi:sensor histidine kinase YesM